MPYVEDEYREQVDPYINPLAKYVEARPHRSRVGVANYTITTFLLKAFPERRYFTFVLVLGTLFCVALEYYRRRVAKYEDEKIKENGDVY